MQTIEQTADPSCADRDAVSLTQDGGVVKRVIKQGYGDLPPLHARCLVHYVGKLEESGEVFMDTRAESPAQEPVRIVAGREAATREVGLNLAVASMQRGERCQLSVAPTYGFGPSGSFSFPAVPCDAQLDYDLELIDFEPVDETREAHTLMYEERLEAAERRRLEGNDLFKTGDARAALGRYSIALSYLNEDFMMQLDGFYLEKANDVKLPIHLNMAACQIKLGDYQTAIHNCSEVLGVDKNNAKALFRRGRARHLLGQTDLAQADLELALTKAPSDQGIARELQALQKTRKAERAAQAQLFRGTLQGPENFLHHVYFSYRL
ncbi:hypothetical protein WJX72_006361 [[Myrmecia] bisecta]|uniref:peptidylprolyl isomerase n=1 Tax=[Myrmecia] bisecta TaxID=41462 RepID=A0AAW1QFC9_9CHLO